MLFKCLIFFFRIVECLDKALPTSFKPQFNLYVVVFFDYEWRQAYNIAFGYRLNETTELVKPTWWQLVEPNAHDGNRSSSTFIYSLTHSCINEYVSYHVPAYTRPAELETKENPPPVYIYPADFFPKKVRADLHSALSLSCCSAPFLLLTLVSPRRSGEWDRPAEFLSCILSPEIAFCSDSVGEGVVFPVTPSSSIEQVRCVPKENSSFFVGVDFFFFLFRVSS